VWLTNIFYSDSVSTSPFLLHSLEVYRLLHVRYLNG
jgi:hypothetical protein